MSKVSPEAFVRVWQEAKSLDEVVENTGLTRKQASSRAGNYRQKGVPLKRFKPINWPDLAALAHK